MADDSTARTAATDLNAPDTGLLHRPPVGGPQDIFYPRPMMVHLPTLVRGEGIYLFDNRQRRFIDVIAGAVLSNLGQGNAAVADAMAEQAKTLTFTYVRYARHLPNIELSAKLASLAGPGFERCLFTSGGSEANDQAIKLLRQDAVARGETKRTRMISMMPSFHGNTLGTIALTGDEDVRELYAPMVAFSEKVPAPMGYRSSPEAAAERTVEALRETLERVGAETVLGFIMEPVGGVATGATVPPDDFYRQVRAVCDAYGIRLVYDEIMTAVRTGRFLAAHYCPDARPDLVVMAKGLGAGYAPIGAVLAPASMVDPLADATGFNASMTYNASPVACAGALAVLSETERLGLADAAREQGNYLKGRLDDLKARLPIVGDVRGKGLLLAIELVTDPVAKTPPPAEVNAVDRLRLIGLENGLILYARRQSGGRYGEWSMITPPLIITRDQCDDLVTRLERCLLTLTDELARKGIMA